MSYLQPLCFKLLSQTMRRWKKKKITFSRLKSPVRPLNQFSETHHNQIHPNEQPSFYPVNYYSRNNHDSRNLSNSRSRYSPCRSSRLRWPSLSDKCQKSRPRNRYPNREFNSNRTRSRSKDSEFSNHWQNSRSPQYSPSEIYHYRCFLDRTLERDKILIIMFLHIQLRQDHVHDLRLHLKSF